MGSLVLPAHEHARLDHYSTMLASATDSGDRPRDQPSSRPTSTYSRTAPSDNADRLRHPARPNPSPALAPSSTPNSRTTPQHDTASAAMSSDPASVSNSPASSRATQSTNISSDSECPPRIKIRDLQHIQSFCSDASSPMAYLQGQNSSAQRPLDHDVQPPQYEISSMPVIDVIEMVAGLLTKITTTNDSQAEQLHRTIPTGPEATVGLSPQTSSVLAFHGKNVPTISIMSYLSRIHKYCPATYEVFLSLLVYFDRITDKVNSVPNSASARSGDDPAATPTAESNEPASRAEPTAAADAGSAGSSDQEGSSALPSPPLTDFDPMSLAHFFAVDSYNIHRLVISGVTCASKFFSDVFYTNSRYAKVGGLPLVELNHLELQFLILNDFRLSIPVEELEAYGTMLVEFYAREVLAQRREESMEGVEAAG